MGFFFFIFIKIHGAKEIRIHLDNFSNLSIFSSNDNKWYIIRFMADRWSFILIGIFDAEFLAIYIKLFPRINHSSLETEERIIQRETIFIRISKIEIFRYIEFNIFFFFLFIIQFSIIHKHCFDSIHTINFFF